MPLLRNADDYYDGDGRTIITIINAEKNQYLLYPVVSERKK